MTRKALNDLAKRLRREGKLPRDSKEVKAELRKSGKILPPYDRKSDAPEKSAPPPAITPIEYRGLQQAYDHFNQDLFDQLLFGDELPDVFITYQRRSHSRGYFSPDRFAARGGVGGKHELALNPDHFYGRSDEEICSTLVHEMMHHWQHANGTAPKRAYHNKEWAAQMKSIGLLPSNTGAVGGKETGSQMSHYILEGGAFQQSFKKLAASGWKLNLQSAPVSGPKGGRNSKTKFTCSECGQNAWGKPDLAVICMHCRIEMKCKSNTAVAEAA
jgi:predicted SprT family Zn-dependent metalloprotease